ncbi:MAG: UbiD family decarboxylase [Deltaproteobacteria bacterium]|nr:UbiD family decarboxylase [Deltaproteobacteria bacterium]
MGGYNDLREWIDQAKDIGELKVIEGADPTLEVGTMVQIDAKNEGPALLFDKLKGHGEGFKVLTNFMANIRLFNLTFGLSIQNSIKDSVEALRMKAAEWSEKAKNFPVKEVTSGPILENVEEGEKIDLEKFPVPLWHELDGGRYIGTGVGVVTRDPDNGELNMGTYRVQLHDRRTVGFYISPGKHGRMHRDKYFARGEPCPVVMIFGLDPLNFALSATEIPAGTFELDYLGAIRGTPVPVIKGKVTGLPIPAHAEIAIEGFADPKETMLEGPFGEWTGTYASDARQEPFIKVAALYYRKNPIILASPPSKGTYNDHGFFRSVWRSALLYNEIERAGIPEVKGVWCPPFGGSRQFVIVSIKQSYSGHATEGGHIASQTRAGAYAGRYVVVVDDDIDPYDIDDVMWAVCTRSEPVEMDIIKKAWSTPLDPRIRKPTDSFHNSRGIIYAVRPYEWFEKFPPTAVASEKQRKEAFSKWADKLNGRWKVI